MDGDSATVAQWQRAMSAMKVALAELDLAAATALESVAAVSAQCAEALAAANRRIDEASARGDAAVARIRHETDQQIDELRHTVQQLRGELEAERELRRASSIAATAATAPIESDLDVDAPSSPASDAGGYGQQLLDHLESVYLADEAAGISGSELVDRLVANLLYASDVFVRRSGAAHTYEVFERQLTAALDAQAGTSFGRRLAVAAFELGQRRKDGRANVA